MEMHGSGEPIWKRRQTRWSRSRADTIFHTMHYSIHAPSPDYTRQVTQLEAAADEAVAQQSRAEVAENERDTVVAKLAWMTPRPSLRGRMLRGQVLDDHVFRLVEQAMQSHRWGGWLMVVVGGKGTNERSGTNELCRRTGGMQG